MRGVRSLSGIAGPGASLAQAGAGGGAVAFELVGSWIYEGDAASSPTIDFTGIPFTKGDLLVVVCCRPSGSGPGVIAGFDQYGDVLSGGGRLTVFTKIADGSETAVTNSASDYQAFACAFSFGVPVDFQGAMSSIDPPAATNAIGATVLTFAFDRTPSLATDLAVTPPPGYALLHAKENDAATLDPSMRVAIKTGCAVNENPGAWSDWTRDDSWGVATLAVEPFGRIT